MQDLFCEEKLTEEITEYASISTNNQFHMNWQNQCNNPQTRCEMATIGTTGRSTVQDSGNQGHNILDQILDQLECDQNQMQLSAAC